MNNEEDVIAVNVISQLIVQNVISLILYVGVNEYILVKEDGELKIKSKKVILKLEALRPQGKVSILL